jgi:hypothetical protein
VAGAEGEYAVASPAAFKASHRHHPQATTGLQNVWVFRCIYFYPDVNTYMFGWCNYISDDTLELIRGGASKTYDDAYNCLATGLPGED